MPADVNAIENARERQLNWIACLMPNYWAAVRIVLASVLIAAATLKLTHSAAMLAKGG
jgi:hypothetical protein